MKFTKVLFNHYRNGEFLQLMKNVLKIIRQYDIDTLNISERVYTLSQEVGELDEAFKPIAGDVLTADLESLDTRRDKALMGIKLILQSHLYREEEDIVEAASAILDSYESHGRRIDKLPYQQETAVVHAFLKDVEDKPVLLEASSKVSVSQWLALLKKLNTAFDDTYIERAKLVSEPAGIEDKRNRIRGAFINLTEDIEAYARIANKEAYVPIITAINGLIKDYNQSVRSRLHAKSPSEDTILDEV